MDKPRQREKKNWLEKQNKKHQKSIASKMTLSNSKAMKITNNDNIACPQI